MKHFSKDFLNEIPTNLLLLFLFFLYKTLNSTPHVYATY
jgi:hypothetical protein